ncbi:putative MFS family arabinose efflux permease [Azospirillum fermentarium]|uniref:MFS transporter n=1 Tax=Azospirillum fermentarium TaxID=1233114 RepID=UPI002227E26E|nr:MFS transporter [Azospirillum fermentarium]MCW2249370.1 putative MFS family arabinose efflux permease [Azospirillum fermentarium]
MTSIQTTHDAAQKAAVPAARPPILLLATGAGMAVASLYYSQPMLGMLGADLGAGEQAVGWVPTLTQIGYAAGLALLAPLGDRWDRRRIMTIKAMILCAALVLAGLSPSIGFLLVASLSLGLAATLAQDIVPAAATLAPAEQRGKVVGMVMTGLLLGILLSRVVSGVVAEQFGWRSMFLVAAAGVAVLGVALRRGLPRFPPVTELGYGALIGSLFTLASRHRSLRRAAAAQGMLAVGFSAFWSTLAVMLHAEPFHLGPAVAGAFGLAGAAGALAAPIAGRIADRRGPELVTRLGAGIAAVSFAIMGLSPLVPAQGQLWLVMVSAVGFDLGIQAALIAHQTIIYGIDPAARSRLNAVLMATMFVGMAVGAALGSQMLAAFGWMGVTALAVSAALAALLIRVWPVRAS